MQITVTEGQLSDLYIRFRKLVNGYTVKWSYCDNDKSDTTFPGGEMYVTDPGNLKDCVSALIDKYLEAEHRKEPGTQNS